MNHLFIFTPGIWRGHGTITLNYSPKVLNFYTQWTIVEEQNGLIKAEQKIEKEGVKEILVHHFLFKVIDSKNFSIDIKSETFGEITATGETSNEKIHWEIDQKIDFEDAEGFTGFETYIKLKNDEYQMVGEYKVNEMYSSTIKGTIWRVS